MNDIWNEFLYESKLGSKIDRAAKFYTSTIIQNVLKRKDKINKKEDFSLKFRSDELEELIPNLQYVVVEFRYNMPITKQKASLYNHKGIMYVYLEFGKDFKDYEQVFSGLIGNLQKDINDTKFGARIFEIIRHEFEHVRQYLTGRTPEVDYEGTKDFFTNLEKYILNDSEVEAFVVQMMKLEKMKPKEQRNLANAFEEMVKRFSRWFRDKVFENEFLNREEKKKICLEVEKEFRQKATKIAKSRIPNKPKINQSL